MSTDPMQITGASSMKDVLSRYPGAQRALFRKYHIGGCSSCGFSPTETVAEVCRRNNQLDISEVMAHIESAHEEDLKIQITPIELRDKLSVGESLRLLDIRTREEWEAARIEGSTLFSQELLQEMLSRWPRTSMIVIYDHFGKQSMDAAAYFLGHGFENVRSLRGGIDAWSSTVDAKVPRYRLENAA